MCGLDRFEMGIFWEAVRGWVEDVWVLFGLFGLVLDSERNECWNGSGVVLLGLSPHLVVVVFFS